MIFFGNSNFIGNDLLLCLINYKSVTQLKKFIYLQKYRNGVNSFFVGLYTFWHINYLIIIF